MAVAEMGILRQAVEETQKQLTLLVTAVADLTATVRVEDARRQELERRVNALERDEDGRRNRVTTTFDQRQIGAQLVALSATVSILTSIFLLALSHVNWK